MSVFPEGNKSYCIISWLLENNYLFGDYKIQLSKLSESERISFLNNFIPMIAENIVIKPTAWDQLESHQKEEFGMIIAGSLIGMDEFLYDNMLEPSSYNLFDL